jgi:hypothetical protein
MPRFEEIDLESRPGSTERAIDVWDQGWWRPGPPLEKTHSRVTAFLVLFWLLSLKKTSWV